MNFLQMIKNELEKEISSREVELKNTEKPLSLSDSLRKGNGIIGEFKRATPTRKFNLSVGLAEVALAYQKAGFSAVSVVVDKKYFLTEENDLLEIRKTVSLPILKKGFFIHPEQVIEARNSGADSLLLIVSLLGRERLSQMLETCLKLKMEAVVEVQSEEDVEEISGLPVEIVGVNNRNLSDLSVDLKRGERVFKYLKEKNIGEVRIVESGLKTPSDIRFFKELGADGFLIGTAFMEAENLAATIEYFLGGLKG